MCATVQIFFGDGRIIRTFYPLEKGQTMKIKLATTCFVIGTLLAPVAALAADSDSDRTHPVTFVKDSVVTAKIKAKLAEEKMSSLTRIKVDTDAKGAVVLRGKVKTQEEADKAASIARGTEGVTSVNSRIRIGEAPVAGHAADGSSDRRHPVTFVKDSVITTKIKAKLAEEKISSLTHIKVDTDAAGAVFLGGRVKTQEEADKAVSIARGTEGVTSVKSNIRVKKAD
jgi:hyperosmotically inducible protein